MTADVRRRHVCAIATPLKPGYFLGVCAAQGRPQGVPPWFWGAAPGAPADLPRVRGERWGILGAIAIVGRCAHALLRTSYMYCCTATHGTKYPLSLYNGICLFRRPSACAAPCACWDTRPAGVGRRWCLSQRVACISRPKDAFSTLGSPFTPMDPLTLVLP